MNNVLILNRRCIKHPQKGGAEIYTYELARALTEKDVRVEWFSSNSGNLADEEEIDGIKFIRKGNELTAHFYGFLYALKKKGWFIIDEFNGIGFFTFFMNNSMLLIHQLYDNFWTAELGLKGYPFKFFEKILLALYKNRPAITVSDSTAEDLKKLGFKDITIIHNGLDILPLDEVPEKEKTLTLIYLGRFKKTKNPEDAIKAFIFIKEMFSDARLWLVGDGPLYNSLKDRYGAVEGLYFRGYLHDTQKYEHLGKAHFLLVPSIREGWGQVVIQANAMGTPVIGYNVAGLKDSIRDGETGVRVTDYHKMSSRILEIWGDPVRYNLMCLQALQWARNFSWGKTRKAFLNYLFEKAILNENAHSNTDL
ncbi:MAG: glycosyltransferase family 4 protein [Nitrospirae bacterium]|nr:glycosyltransferase family 4 protein [Nitrospirota bacterium]